MIPHEEEAAEKGKEGRTEVTRLFSTEGIKLICNSSLIKLMTKVYFIFIHKTCAYLHFSLPSNIQVDIYIKCNGIIDQIFVNSLTTRYFVSHIFLLAMFIFVFVCIHKYVKEINWY